MATLPILRGTVLALVITLILWFLQEHSPTAHASGIVGNGTPQSCTSQALADAITGGGLVTFNCGAAPATIIITATGGLSIAGQSVTIDGADKITLSGANSTRIFNVFSAGNLVGNLTLQNLTLTKGWAGSNDMGGCILNDGGVLNLYNTIVENCSSDLDGGAIVNNIGGRATITSGTIRYNVANRTCGAICDFGMFLILSNTLVFSNTALGLDVGGVGSTGVVTITNSTIMSNTAYRDGGGLYNNTRMTVQNSTLVGNRTTIGIGGGIDNDGGILTVTASVLQANYAGYGGAGIATWIGTTMLENVTLSNNQTGTTGLGGGVYNDASTLNVRNTTISGNSAGSGGGILNYINGIITLENGTLSSNTASDGGGISNYKGTITVTNATLNNNVAQSGGGIDHYSNNAKTITLKNTIVNNPSGGNCYIYSGSVSIISSDGFNLSGDNSCTPYLIKLSDWNNINPYLGALTNNGGPTLTHMPFPPSKAIDNGQCVVGITTDQRGVARPAGLSCDIGAVEYHILYQLFLPLIMR